jgi:hypothetical protein
VVGLVVGWLGVGAQAQACACSRVALLIRHATPMRDIIFLFVASQAPPHFSTLSENGTIFGKRY